MLITNATLITWETENRVLPNHALYIDKGLIADLGPDATMRAKYPDAEILDARGQFVMPGGIVAHTHFYGAYARGLAIPGSAPRDFPHILKKLWWPLDKALDAQSVRASARVHLLDAIRHGATTLIDHHASPNFIDGSLDVIADVVDEAGLRAVLCYEVTDRDGPERAQAGIDENLRFLKALRERVRGTFGLHANLTLDDATLEKCREAAPDGIGFHIHAAEHEADEDDSLARSGLRVIHRLHKHGILGPNTIVAHGVRIDAREQALLAETNTWLTHQPRSNMNNAVGAAPVEAMLRLGINVCLGNDGFSQTVWKEMKAAYLLHKHEHGDPRRMNGIDVIQMGVYNNAALASRFFEAPLGVLRPGAHADLVFVDYQPFTPLTAGNLPWHILFGFNESMVTTTIVAGQALMRDGQFLTLDPEEVVAHALEQADGVWERYAVFVPAD